MTEQKSFFIPKKTSQFIKYLSDLIRDFCLNLNFEILAQFIADWDSIKSF